MLKNLKHSIVFILIVIMLLSVVVMSSAASKSVSINTATALAPKYRPWSGLGMTIWYSELDDYADVLLDNFTDFRFLLDYHQTARVTNAHAAMIRAIAKGANLIWGVSAGVALTMENWSAFRQAILDEAQWSQDNGVFEFQLGNEEEYRYGYRCVAGTLVRSNNVVTVTTPTAHGFDGTHQVTVSGMYWDDPCQTLPVNMNGTFDITVTGTNTFTYVANGANGSNTTTAVVSDLPIATLIANLKSVATEVQAIFTRGKVSYTLAYPWISDWTSAGKGDIDLIGGNIYQDNECWKGDWFSDAWKTEIDDLINAFGTDGTYLSEFNLSGGSLDLWSTDEAVQAAAIADMIEYIKSTGITRADFYCFRDYEDAHFGAMKLDNTYRKLWNVLTSN